MNVSEAQFLGEVLVARYGLQDVAARRLVAASYDPVEGPSSAAITDRAAAMQRAKRVLQKVRLTAPPNATARRSEPGRDG